MLVGKVVFLDICGEGLVLLGFLEGFNFLLLVNGYPSFFEEMQILECFEDGIVLGLEIGIGISALNLSLLILEVRADPVSVPGSLVGGSGL